MVSTSEASTSGRARRPAMLFVPLLFGMLLARRTHAAAGGDIVAADGALLFRVDATTGARSVLSDFSDPTQGPTGSSFGVAAGSDGAVYVTDGVTDEQGKLFQVLTDGTRIVRSDAADPAQGDPWHTPHGVFVDTDGSILVSDRGIGGGGNAAGLWRVAATDGSRVKLADFGGAPEGITLDSTGHILLGDAEGGTNCHTFGGCGALYEVAPMTGVLTPLADFGDAAQGPLGEDAGKALALDTDDTILVVDPFAPPGSSGCFDTGGCGVVFRWDPATHMHTHVTKYGDATEGTVAGFRPRGVVVGMDGTIFVSPCPGSGDRGAICTVDRATGARTTFSDFGDPTQGPLGFGPISLAIADLGSTTTTTTTTTATTSTTTTLQGECGTPAPTFDSIICRLERLIVQVDAATDLNRLDTTLTKALAKAHAKAVTARDLAAAGRAKKKVRSTFKVTQRKIIGFIHRLQSLSARKLVSEATRNALIAPAKPIQADAKALLGML